MELLIRPNAIDSQTITHYLAEGPTLEEALIASGWDMALRDFTIVIVNNQEVTAWGDYRPKEGDVIRVMLRPSGGRGGGAGKQILAAVAIIVVAIVAAYAAPILAGALAPALGITSAAGVAALGAGIAAGITIAGALAIGALVKAPSMSQGTIGANPDNSFSDSNSIYSVSGASNSVNRYGVVPRLYGRVRVTPPHAVEPIVVASGPSQSLRGILDFGYGPLSVQDIRLGTTPISDFPTARYVIHPYYKAGDPLTIYTNDEATLQVGAVLSQGVDNIRQLPQKANAAYFEFGFPGGLIQFDQQGKAYLRREHISIFARRVSGGGWFSVGDVPHWAWYDSSHIGGIGQSGDVQLGVLNVVYAQNSNRTIFVDRNGFVPSAGQFVRWAGGTYSVNAVGTVTPPKYASQTRSVTLSDLPPGIAWGNSLLGPDYAMIPLSEGTMPSVWRLGYNPSGTNLWVTFGPSIYDVEFHGQTRVPRTVTVAMMMPDYDEWEVLVRRSTPESTDPLIANGITWTSVRAQAWASPIAPRQPRTIMEFEITATDQVSGQVAAINALVTSMLYDPRVDLVVPTRNPAWVYADLLTGTANKNRIDWSRLDEAKLIEWADWCDDQSPQGDANATCDLAIDYRTTVGEAAQTIAAAGRAMPVVRDGAYSVIMENEDRIPVQMFTNRNAREFKFTRMWADEPHGVKIRYLSEVSWDRDEQIVYMDGYDANNSTKFDTLDLVGTVRPQQAFRMGRYYLGQLRLRKERCELQADVENLVCQRGDLVQVAHDRLLRSAVTRAVSLERGVQVNIDSDFDQSALVSQQAGDYWPGNAGTPTGMPPGWLVSGQGGAGVTTVQVIGKGVDEDGLDYCDIRLASNSLLTSTVSIRPFGQDSTNIAAEINNDDVIYYEQHVKLIQANLSYTPVYSMDIQPLSTVGGAGMGTNQVAVLPDLSQVMDLSLADSAYIGVEAIGPRTANPAVVNQVVPLFRISTVAGQTMDIIVRLSGARIRVQNRKIDYLERFDNAGTNLLPNSSAEGSVLGVLSGSGGDGSTPGRLPTGWFTAQYAGWTREVIRIDRTWSFWDVDVRLRADAGAAYCSVVFSEIQDLPPSKIFSCGVLVQQVSVIGSPPTYATRVTAYTEDDTFIQNNQTNQTLSTNNVTWEEQLNVNYSGVSGAERFVFAFIVTPAVGQATDVTLRFRLPIATEGSTSPINSLPAEDPPPSYYADIRLSDGTLLSSVPVLDQPASDALVFDQGVTARMGPEDIIALGGLETETTEWIVDGIVPGSDLSATLNLIEYAPELQTVDSEPIPPYIPPNSDTGFVEQLGPVRNANLLIAQGYSGAFAVSFLKASWLPPSYSAAHYVIERVLSLTGLGNRQIVAQTSDTSYSDVLPTEGIPATGAPVSYFITPVTNRGQRGEELEITGTVFPDTAAPDAPVLTSNVMGTMTRLLWTIPKAPDVVSYQIRWSPDYTTSAWNRMQILVGSVTGSTNTVSVHTRSGLYAIRALDRAGNWSPASFTRTLVEMAPAVDSSYEMGGPPWNGTFENVEINGDGDLVLSIDPSTGEYFPSGFFYFDNPLSLQQVWGVRIQANTDITSLPDDPDSSAHDAQVIMSVLKTLPLLNSAWFTPLANAVPLAGSPTAFGQWTPVIEEWMDGKVFYSGVWLRSFDGITTPVVKAAKAELFFDPRQEAGNDVPAPGGVLQVTYRFPFVETPGLQITLNNGDRDDFIIRTASSPTGFTVEIRSGNGQLVPGRNIDWVAIGYGIGLGG
jgi:hypothetical protein